MAAVEVAHVSKTFRIPHERHTHLAERLISLFRPVGFETLAALNDVSLEIPAGSFVGIIGANGSGKSTLLKVIAGLLVPDQGEVRVNGTLAPLLELGLGFHHELTVHENVVLYGSVLGYPRREIVRRVDEVIAFAGLERFRDAKLKSLSSGMLVRLAFATALRADADVLLLDEVLAVGDAQFQRKCIEVFTDLRRQRRTIAVVSHDLLAVQRFCDKVFWLDRGRLVMGGDAAEVVQTYLGVGQSVGAQLSLGGEPGDASEHRYGDGLVRYVRGSLESEDGASVWRVKAGQRLVLRLEVEAQRPCENPVFGFMLRCGDRTVYSTNTVLLEIETGGLLAGDRAGIRIPFVAGLANGHYVVTVVIASLDATIHDWVSNFIAFQVEGSRCLEGVADLGAEFHWEPEARPMGQTAGQRQPS